MTKALLLDTNVILDVFLERSPFAVPAARLLSLIEAGHFQGYVSASSFPVLFYIMSREASREVARSSLEKLHTLLNIAPVDERVVSRALVSDFSDFEDAIQYYSALGVKAHFIITRNTRDFSASELPVFSPDEMLALIESGDPALKARFGLN